MTNLDSRTLQTTNCYARKFAKTGKVIYRLAPVAADCGPDGNDSFIVEVVSSKTKETQQHNVVVRLEDRRLVADPPHLKVQVGDMVLWHANGLNNRSFAIRGKGAGGQFSSSSLDKEVVFTHAFGSPGTFEWIDANGSPIKGVIEVVSPDTERRGDCDKWIKSLEKGFVIHIVDKKVRPAKLKVSVGQTVFWAVEKAPGITITDSRLVAPSKPAC